MLRSLIESAIQWAAGGGVQISVAAERQTDGWHLTYDVLVRGPRVDVDAIAASLEPVSEQTPQQCTLALLRLASVCRLAKLLGGAIEVVPAEHGATVRWVLRAGVNDGEIEQADVHHDRSGATAISPLQGNRILLVEDGADASGMVATVLQLAGASVDVAGSGEAGIHSALTAMRAGTPHELILMDIEMPVMDGCAATRSLRQDGFDGAIIALTVQGLVEDRRRCIEAGCDGHAMKPLTRQALLQLVVRTLAADSRGRAA